MMRRSLKPLAACSVQHKDRAVGFQRVSGDGADLTEGRHTQPDEMVNARQAQGSSLQWTFLSSQIPLVYGISSHGDSARAAFLSLCM